MKKIALLGSTGSIGRQVLACVDRYPDKFKIVSLAANSSAELLQEQVLKYKPQVVGLSDSSKADKITSIPNGTTLFVGEQALLHASMVDCDVVFVAVVGFCGIEAVKLAVESGKTIALANKESLVCGGELITSLAKKHNATIIPVDSEHSAIWQSLGFDKNREFEKLIITASGGAFRDKTPDELLTVTSIDALKHPNWNMGKKITIDCATMVNKGFEVIEAMWLFNAPINKIEVLIHKESIVHSMVEYSDGGIIAQMGLPNMEVPIQLALTYPDRFVTSASGFSLANKSLHFEPVQKNKYPCFELVLESIKLGHNYPCAVSSANEEIVALFLQDKIRFTQIKEYLEVVLNKIEKMDCDLESLKLTDRLAREIVRQKFKGENA